jgi:hypothetical protein
VNKNKCCFLFIPAVLGSFLLIPGQANGTPERQSAARIAELDKQIEEQKAVKSTVMQKIRQIMADSGAAISAADNNIAALMQTMRTISGTVSQSKNSLTVLRQSMESFKSIAVEKETGLKAACFRLHSSIASFDNDVAAQKQILLAAKKNYERVQSDSIALGKRIGREMALLRDSLASIEKALAGARLQVGNFSAMNTSADTLIEGAALTKLREQQDLLTRKRDDLSSFFKDQETLHRSELDAAHEPVGKAFNEQKNAQAGYDAVAAQQQKARDDSASIAKDIGEQRAKAMLSADMKQEEITVKNGQHEKLLAQLKAAQVDSASVANYKREQQISFQKMLLEQRRLILVADKKIKDLEEKRAAFLKNSGGK